MSDYTTTSEKFPSQTRYGVTLSQQVISWIANGKPKVDAERELPAFAAVYGQPIDYFVFVDYDALTQQGKLQLAADLIHQVLPET